MDLKILNHPNGYHCRFGYFSNSGIETCDGII